jgi:hypothetical protein
MHTHTHTEQKEKDKQSGNGYREIYVRIWHVHSQYMCIGISRKYKKEKGEKSSNRVRFKFNSACAGRRDYMEHKRIFKELLYKRCDLISFPQIVCFFSPPTRFTNLLSLGGVDEFGKQKFLPYFVLFCYKHFSLSLWQVG